MGRYFEDFSVGERFESGTVTLSEADIIAFARDYDPQLFHLDPVAAKLTPFGGLIASGWHTAALSMRLIVQGGLIGEYGGVGLGIDKLRWLRPAYPGDTLRVVVTVASLRPTSDGRGGIAYLDTTMRNQKDEEIMTYSSIVMIPRRPPPAQAA